MTKEIWVDLIVSPDMCEISNFGNLRNKVTKQNIKLYINNRGYQQVNIFINKNKTKQTFKVHRLVYYSFYPDTDKDYDIHHIDENKSNNKLSNLMALSKSAHAKLEQKLVKAGFNKKIGKEHQSFKGAIAGFCSITGELKYIFNGYNEIINSGLRSEYVYKSVRTNKKYSKYHNLIFKKFVDDTGLKIGKIYNILHNDSKDRIIAIDLISKTITDILIGTQDIKNKGFSPSSVYRITQGKLKTHKNHTFLRISDQEKVAIGQFYEVKKLLTSK